MSYLALVGGTVHTGPVDDPIRDATVLIQDATIVAVGGGAQVPVPEAARTLDCSGHTITAGFWNSHVHFFEQKWADAATIPASELAQQLQDMFLRHGFTSVFDISSQWQNTRHIRDRIESGEVPGPHIRSTGEALVAPGAAPSRETLRALGFLPATLATADAAQAAAAARTLLDNGVDGIKVHLQPPPPPHPPFPVSAISAVVEQAHRFGRPVFVHPNSAADVLTAVRAGVDVIAHTTPQSRSWEETLLSAMYERRVALTPTLTVWQHIFRHDRTSLLRRFADNTVGQLRAWVGTGGTVLFGTDIGAAGYDPSQEYAMMAEAGMTFGQVLAALTTAPAGQFGESDRSGRVAAGFRADLVVLTADPAQDLRALARVRHTLRAGEIVYSMSADERGDAVDGLLQRR